MEDAAALVEFFGRAAGETAETVLLDLREGKRCVTAIYNGHVSGRAPGAPLTGRALRMEKSGVWKTRSCVCNYRGRSADGRLLRSSVYFIRDGDVLLGMLCVNVDAARFIHLGKELFRLGGVYSREGAARGAAEKRNAADLYQDREAIIGEVFTELAFDGETETPDQEWRLVIIERLVERGVFLLRGSVASVAKKLRCSEASLYRYIGMIHRRGRGRDGAEG